MATHQQSAFVANTRQAIRTMASNVEYASGGRSIYALPRTGLLARVHLHFSGTMTVTPGTGSAALGAYGPYALVNRIKLIANQGTSIIDLSGYGAHLLDSISNGKPYAPQAGAFNGLAATAFAGDLYSAGVSSGDNAWAFGITLNITPNDRDPIGAILLQTDQMAAELQFDWNGAFGTTNDYPVVVTGNATASFAGNVEITLETFTVPAAGGKPDVSQVFQQLERQEGISATGPVAVNLLRNNVYARIAHLVQIGGAPNYADVVSGKIVYNGTDTPYHYSRKAWQALQRRRYGRDLPEGVFVHDLFYQGIPGYGGPRDLVNAKSVSEFASVLEIDNGASVSPTNSWIRTLTQQFVSVGVPGQ